MSSILDKLLKGQSFEWKTLGEVSEFKYGKGNTIPTNGGKYPVYGCNGIVGTHDQFNNENSPIIGHIGTAGIVVWGEGKHFVTYNGTICNPKKDILLSKYVYHYLLTLRLTELTKGSQPFLSYDTLKKICIPIPPLDVQAKIVKILDAFTALTAELTAELTMREKQYHYYRDNLLTFSDDVEWKALGDVVLPTKNIKWKETNLSYQYIDLSSVDRGNNNIGETLEITSKNAPSRAQKIVKQDDIIFATTRPTQMRVAIIPKNFDEQIASTGYCILRANQKEILPKWIYYNLSLDRFKFYLEENQSGVAYPAISDGIVKEFQIPIPSLKEQKRIIEILDNFEIFNHSITEGLPFEIALRQKQYEYYREQLLDFPKS